MNIQEMATIANYRLPVKILNLNNKVLGMIRQWQELFHGNLESECDLSGSPDFVKLAEAFGFEALTASRPDEVDDAIIAMLESEGPCFLNMGVDRFESVYPMIPAGAAHYDIVLGPNDQRAEVDDDDLAMASLA